MQKLAEGGDASLGSLGAFRLREDAKQGLGSREAANDKSAILKIDLAAVLVIDARHGLALKRGEYFVDHQHLMDLRLSFRGEREVCLYQLMLAKLLFQCIEDLGGRSHRADHFDKEGSGIDGILSVDVSAHGKSSRGFAAEDRVIAVDARGDVLESNRYLVTFLSKGSRDLVQHMRGCEVAHDRALPTLNRAEVVIEQAKDLVCVDVSSRSVYHAKAVAVAVKGDTEVIFSLYHTVAQVGQSAFGGSGDTAAEVRVLIIVDQIHRATHGLQDDHDGIDT